MKNRKIFFKQFVMGIVIFFMVVFELQMIWGSVYISKTVTKERRNSYASALEIYSSNLEQQLKQIDPKDYAALLKEAEVIGNA